MFLDNLCPSCRHLHDLLVPSQALEFYSEAFSTFHPKSHQPETVLHGCSACGEVFPLLIQDDQNCVINLNKNGKAESFWDYLNSVDRRNSYSDRLLSSSMQSYPSDSSITIQPSPSLEARRKFREDYSFEWFRLSTVENGKTDFDLEDKYLTPENVPSMVHSPESEDSMDFDEDLRMWRKFMLEYDIDLNKSNTTINSNPVTDSHSDSGSAFRLKDNEINSFASQCLKSESESTLGDNLANRGCKRSISNTEPHKDGEFNEKKSGGGHVYSPLMKKKRNSNKENDSMVNQRYSNPQDIQNCCLHGCNHVEWIHPIYSSHTLLRVNPEEIKAEIRSLYITEMSQKRPYICLSNHNCVRNFSRETSVENHLFSRLYFMRCPNCDKIFKILNRLKSHLRKCKVKPKTDEMVIKPEQSGRSSNKMNEPIRFEIKKNSISNRSFCDGTNGSNTSNSNLQLKNSEDGEVIPPSQVTIELQLPNFNIKIEKVGPESKGNVPSQTIHYNDDISFKKKGFTSVIDKFDEWPKLKYKQSKRKY